MTTITVTAADTAQAMDKIVERLGDDALILETVKRNGRIEMIATNDPDEAQSPAPAPASHAAQSAPAETAPAPLDVQVGNGLPFTDLFDQQMINTIRDRGQPAGTTADHLVGRAMEAAENIDVLTELRSIRQMLGGMMITRPEGLDVTLGHAAPVRLHQAGFSSAAIQQLHQHMVGLSDDQAVSAFTNALADRVVHDDVDSPLRLTHRLRDRQLWIWQNDTGNQDRGLFQGTRHLRSHDACRGRRPRHQRQRGHQDLCKAAEHARHADWRWRDIDCHSGNKQPDDHRSERDARGCAPLSAKW